MIAKIVRTTAVVKFDCDRDATSYEESDLELRAESALHTQLTLGSRNREVMTDAILKG